MIAWDDLTPEELLIVLRDDAARHRRMAEQTSSPGTRILASRAADKYAEQADRLEALIRRASLRAVDEAS